MSAESRPPLRVVLCWHMHQPEYREPLAGHYQLPWTYLHAIKDYVDMAAHLEEVPAARAVVNFTPTLLEQLDDYAAQLEGFLERGEAIRDPLLNALASPVPPCDPEGRLELIRACLRANQGRMIDPHPPFRRLAELGRWLLENPHQVVYIGDRFFTDLVVWYHIAWMGETVRAREEWLQQLIARGGEFTIHDRSLMLQCILRLISGIAGRYRALAEAGRVELSVTPYAHPILPLLLDMESARQAVPDLPLPEVVHYPGGEARARWHIQRGIEVFERHFGMRPEGCWPAEGGVCDHTLALLSEAGFRWAATGAAVLHNSLRAAGEADRPACLHRSWQVGELPLRCFFRDDGLSDLIGFTYSDWNADDAVANLIHHLEQIDLACEEGEAPVVSIILDGENAWEYYPHNGYFFLHALYSRLAEHPRIHLTTFSGVLQEAGETGRLSRLVAGSWVYGTFTTWIGHADKNRAWCMLAEGKRVADLVLEGLPEGDERREAIERQLAICEGSDWFWWFGDDNPAESVADFDRLYRLQLVNLYRLLGEEPPEYLAHAFSHGGGTPELGGVMRAGTPPTTAG